MGEKPVMALAGIGEVLGKRLEEKGFDKVTCLVFFCFCFCFLRQNKCIAWKSECVSECPVLDNRAIDVGNLLTSGFLS